METFDGNTGFERFAYGAYHREVGHHWGRTPEPGGLDNNSLVDGSWTGDHDQNCGSPSSQRQLGVSSVQDTTGSSGWVPTINWNTDEFFYNCRDHLMTSMGGTAGYSILWFSPDMVFDTVTEVSFDVNLTDLGSRQWIKWGIVSDALYQSTYRGGFLNAQLPGFIVTDTSLAGTAAVRNFINPGLTIATWSGAGTDTGFEGVGINGRRVATAPTAGNDKASRFPVTLVDNGNGTITASVNGNAGTTSGSFPECPCRVVFYDHNYDPDKDGMPVGHTWHWDNFVIR